LQLLPLEAGLRTCDLQLLPLEAGLRTCDLQLLPLEAGLRTCDLQLLPLEAGLVFSSSRSWPHPCDSVPPMAMEQTRLRQDFKSVCGLALGLAHLPFAALWWLATGGCPPRKGTWMTAWGQVP
jgi:hypothetical protein